MTLSQRSDLMQRLTLLSACGILLVALLLLVVPPRPVHAAGTAVSVWMTTADQKNLLTQQTNAPPSRRANPLPRKQSRLTRTPPISK